MGKHPGQNPPNWNQSRAHISMSRLEKFEDYAHETDVHHPFVDLRAIGEKNGAEDDVREGSEIAQPIIEMRENGGTEPLEICCRFFS